MLFLICSFLLVPLPNAVATESTDILPIDVQVDLLMTKLSNLLKVDDNEGIIELIPQLRALEIEIPDSGTRYPLLSLFSRLCQQLLLELGW